MIIKVIAHHDSQHFGIGCEIKKFFLLSLK
ncbi:uncharacterized protein METZ01_LOCUS353928, partial [marine metagenome]